MKNRLLYPRSLIPKKFPYPLPTLASDEVIGKARSQDCGIV
ncbi:hypothetical protein [Coleofasciculus chthonoplastes]